MSEHDQAPAGAGLHLTGSGAGRLVVLAIGAWDRRAIGALQVAAAIPADEHRAVHVATDDCSWTELGACWQQESVAVPLAVVDAEGRSVAATLAAILEEELMCFREIAVIVGRLDVSHRRHRLLHARTADDILRTLAALPHTTVSCVNVGTV